MAPEESFICFEGSVQSTLLAEFFIILLLKDLIVLYFIWTLYNEKHLFVNHWKRCCGDILLMPFIIFPDRAVLCQSRIY